MLILLGLVLLKVYSRVSLKNQKHAARITFHANRFDHSRPLIKKMKALNVYQINIIQILKFMLKTKYGINPQIFLTKFVR